MDGKFKTFTVQDLTQSR